MRVTILKAGVVSEYGIAWPVGSVQTTITVDYGKSLVQSGVALDTDNYLAHPINRPFASSPTPLSGPLTFATLPTAVQMAKEAIPTVALTSDMGICTWNGRAWVALMVKNRIGARVLTHNNASAFALSGNNYTWSLAAALPADVVAVQLICGNSTAAGTTGVIGAVSNGSTKTDLLNNAGAWVSATWGGASSTTLAPGSVNSPTITLSDWLKVPKAPGFTSSTGVPLQMFYARIMTPLANANVQLYGESTTIGPWATIADDQVWAWRFQIGDFVTVPTGMTGSTDPSAAPILGLRYMTQTQSVINVLFIGDSITVGFGCTPRGYAWPHQAAQDSMAAGQIMACTNGANNGITTAVMASMAAVLIPVYLPQIVVFPIWSPNNSGAPIDSTIQGMLADAGQIIDLCTRNNAKPVICTSTPWATDGTNTVAAMTATQDAFRLKAGTLAKQLGISYADFDAALGDGNSPELWLTAALTSDGKHPANGGNNLMFPAAGAAIRNVF